MTSENLAKHRLDPNIAFWKELKNGADHFEVTKAEVPVLVCDRHYVFGAKADGDIPRAALPAADPRRGRESAVAAKASKDEAEVAELVAKGVKPIRLVYDDGGQNPAFAGKFETSRPDALAQGPREIVLDNKGKPVPAAVEVAERRREGQPGAAARARKPRPGRAETAVAATPPRGPSGGGLLDGGKRLMANCSRRRARRRRRCRCSSRKSRSPPTRRCRRAAPPRSSRRCAWPRCPRRPQTRRRQAGRRIAVTAS